MVAACLHTLCPVLDLVILLLAFLDCNKSLLALHTLGYVTLTFLHYLPSFPLININMCPLCHTRPVKIEI
jgi:hypothetical protein